ncbi:MAG TPA: c-type cytochrome [Gemmatimonadaceae bacterium]|nr:c-type cytochrome [Gemmatimonadaceae bacterium]
MKLLGAALAAALIIAGCDGEDRPGAIGDTSIAYSLPDSARGDSAARDSVPSTVEGTDSLPPGDGEAALTIVSAADSAAGDSIFHRQGRCFTCHGAAGEGMATLGPALLDDRWLHGDGSVAFIERIIASGVATPKEANIAMPAFEAQLTAEQIRAVASYVYVLARPDAMQRDTVRTDSMPVRAP